MEIQDGIIHFCLIPNKGGFWLFKSILIKRIMDFSKLDFCSSINHKFINIGQNVTRGILFEFLKFWNTASIGIPVRSLL